MAEWMEADGVSALSREEIDEFGPFGWDYVAAAVRNKWL